MITSVSVPANFSSGHYELFHVFSSDNSTTINFKYVVDITIGGNKVATLKVFPDVNGYGIVDVSTVLRNYYSSAFKPSGTGVLAYTGSEIAQSYTLNIGEDLNGTITTNLFSGTYSAYNTVATLGNESLSTFIGKFLTIRDKDNVFLSFGENYYATFFNYVTTSTSIKVEILNEAGAVLNTYTGTALATTGNISILNLGANSINLHFGSTIITANTEAYRVTINNTDSLVIKEACEPRFTAQHVVFLNSLGGYETYHFRLVSKQTRTFTRSKYQTKDFANNAGTIAKSDSYGRVYGGNISYNTRTDIGYKFTTDYLSDNNYLFLSELLSSNEIYWQYNNLWYPILPTSTNWESKRQLIDKNFNMEITFDLGRPQYSQYR